MGQPVSRLGDHSDHGGVIITASSDMFVDSIPAARLTDLHSCPIPGHGITPIVTASSDTFNDNLGLAHVGSKTGCGATIIQGSGTTFVD